MRSLSISRFFLILALLVFAATYEASAQQVVSSMRNVRAVMQDRGFYIVPAGNMAVSHSPSDLAPVQTFEIVRPRGERITIGRLYTSCTCVQLEATKRTFEPGERATLNLRNVIATPPAGQVYAVYVQITSPIRTTLRYDTFVQSSHFVSSTPITSTPTPIDGIEVIVPKADDAVAAAADAKREDAVADASKDGKTENETLDTAQSGIQDDADAEPAEAGVKDEKEAAPEAEATAEEDPAGVSAGDAADSEADEGEAATEEAPAAPADDQDVEAEPADTGDVADTEDVIENSDPVDIEDPVDPDVEATTI